jgi:hypothetical protein
MVLERSTPSLGQQLIRNKMGNKARRRIFSSYPWEMQVASQGSGKLFHCPGQIF